jgi:alginate O-acetyltransferase complex protein AlgI
MSFNSLFFILFFLPVCVGIYYLLPKRGENIFLLLINILFYFLCDEFLVLILLCSAVVNYLLGRLLFNRRSKGLLLISILVNLLPLGFFKYHNFFSASFHDLFGFIIPNVELSLLIPDLILPLGISYFTFRAISYQVDVYRRKTEPGENLLSFLVYFTLFPVITAGPITRYSEIKDKLNERDVNFHNFIRGVERFISGLIKKNLLAGTFAVIADRVFSAPIADLSMGMAWIGILSYTLQIFFDFSGYTDMALGIGGILGFRFAENFNYPYVAKNIQDFWQRWHITLSTWLRDYIFLPLAFLISNRLKNEHYFLIRTDRIIYAIAILTTFFICGFWHGAGWNYIIWGLYFAVFLTLEQFGLKKLLKHSWSPLRHLYTLLVVVVGWVIFRSENMDVAFRYVIRMFSFSNGNNPVNSEIMFYIANAETIFVTLLAIYYAIPVKEWLDTAIKNNIQTRSIPYYTINSVRIFFFIILFLVSLSYTSSSLYQPFLYAKF